MSGPLSEDYTTSAPVNPRQSSWSDTSSPWGSTATPQRQGPQAARRSSVSSTIQHSQPALPPLNDSNVPPLYQSQWKAAQPVRGTISLGSLTRVLTAGGIKASSIDKIISLTNPSSGIITSQVFYTALALLANAQLHRDLSLDMVARALSDGSLPLPTLPTSSAYSVPSSPTQSFTSPPSYDRTTPVSSVSEDPWGTGQLSSITSPSAKTNGHYASTSAPKTFSPVDGDEDRGNVFGENLLEGTSLGEWALGKQKTIEVRMRDELKGMLFKHTVWFIASERGATVERRYSDFVWLHDCLVRRYPFRLLPVLPPKQVHVPGYFVTDDLFLERRRKGLERFLVLLINHPTLRHDHLVNTFLNEQSDLSLWRKHTPISLEEESASRILTSEEEMQVPSDLEERLTNLRARIVSLVEHWTRVTATMDRIAHRRQNQAADMERMTAALQAALEIERGGWRPVECENVEQDVDKLATGIQSASARIRQASDRLLETTVEELKRHRELYVNMKELFTRHVQLSPDAVDKLKKRVEVNMKKLESFRDSAAPLPPTEFDKLSYAISSDQRSIDLLLRRRSFIRWCMWQEVLWLFRSTSLLSTAAREWVNDEILYGDNVKARWEETQEALGPLWYDSIDRSMTH